MTETQKEIMLHTLGASRKGAKLGYRNYYCAAIDDPNCNALLAAGLMRAGRLLNDGQDQYFIVTEAGMIALGLNPAEVNAS
ncbi:hypothetical protein EBT16_00935 [bacterium]|nr:hypothetical protein [bacterium]